jgi:hypothetical protein
MFLAALAVGYEIINGDLRRKKRVRYTNPLTA